MLLEDKILELYIAKHRQLCTYAHRFIADYDTCKDIVQDVFLSLYEGDHASFEKASNSEGFLYTCIKNKCLDSIKGKSVRERYSARILRELSKVDEDAIPEYEITELANILDKLVNSLQDPTYTIFYKSRFEGKRNYEIAEEMEISIKTVEAHITKALKHIKYALVKLTLLFLIAIGAVVCLVNIFVLTVNKLLL
jgi:RNA polymerase sigma-70 factor, Bacteroides expansion family 1